MATKKYDRERGIKEAPNEDSDLNLNAYLKGATRAFYRLIKRASQSDIYNSNYMEWLAEPKTWTNEMERSLYYAGDAVRLNYLMDIDASLDECMVKIDKRIHGREEVSARKLLGWLYPYFVGVNDFTESYLIEISEMKKYENFKKTRSKLDKIIENSIAKNKFPPIRLGTKNYTFYILDTAEPLTEEEVRGGHRKTWVGMTENAEIFAESIDEIIQQKLIRNKNVSLGEVSYPFVVGRALKKYTKAMKAGSLAV